MSLPDISAKTFTISAALVGYILINDLTPYEQNALGNWLMLTAQVLCTNATYGQLQSTRSTNQEMDKESTMKMIEKMITAMQKELDDLRK